MPKMVLITSLAAALMLSCGLAKRTTRPPATGVVIVGDSILIRITQKPAVLSLWASLTDGIDTEIVGRGGAYATRLLQTITEGTTVVDPKHPPRLLVVWCGINDMNIADRSPEQVAHTIEVLVDEAHDRGAENVLVLSILPLAEPYLGWDRVAPANKMLARAMSARRWASFMDLTDLVLESGSVNASLYEDYVHPSDAGYEVFLPAISQRIRDSL